MYVFTYSTKYGWGRVREKQKHFFEWEWEMSIRNRVQAVGKVENYKFMIVWRLSKNSNSSWYFLNRKSYQLILFIYSFIYLLFIIDIYLFRKNI